MNLRPWIALAALAWLAAAPTPAPTPAPTTDPYANNLFNRAKEYWHARTDVPYVRYGALQRYLHNNHVFDNWWDVYVRTSDGQMSMQRLIDVDEEHRRLSGIPFSIFGVQIFDTNPDSEPIRLEDPQIEPDESFGIISKYGNQRTGSMQPPSPSPEASTLPSPAASSDFRLIGSVESSTRDYVITYAGIEQLRDGPAQRIHLEPVRDPSINRLRDVWIDPKTYRTMQSRVAGILRGEPYDKVSWKVTYVELEGRNYLQQVVAESPLHFGIDTEIPKFEIDLVDYHFPADVPKFTFDKPFSL